MYVYAYIDSIFALALNVLIDIEVRDVYWI
jgi:hypothetical protein